MTDLRPVFAALLALAPAPAFAPAAAQAQDMAPQTLTLQCTAKNGEGVQLEGGVLMTYFSAGTGWSTQIDLDNGLATVDLRIDRRGTQITFAEKYRVTINGDYYVLQSTEVKTGALSNGVYNIHSIETTLDRHTGLYRRQLRLQNLNSNTGTYAYFTELGECSVKPAAADPALTPAPPPAPGPGPAPAPAAPVPPAVPGVPGAGLKF
ncbi:MAG: hypothetical protein WCJ64_04065 [Rhodospirillaceae bacterium]